MYYSYVLSHIHNFNVKFDTQLVYLLGLLRTLLRSLKMEIGSWNILLNTVQVSCAN